MGKLYLAFMSLGDPVSESIQSWPRCSPFVGHPHADEAVSETAAALEAGLAAALVGKTGVGKTAIAYQVACTLAPECTALRVATPVLMTGAVLGPPRERRLLSVIHLARVSTSGLLVLEDADEACRRFPAPGSCTPIPARLFESRTPQLLAEAVDRGLACCMTLSPDGPACIDEPRLLSKLHVVPIREPTAEQIDRQILPVVGAWLGRHCNVLLQPAAYATVRWLSSRRPGCQPGKAIRHLRMVIRRGAASGLRELTPDDITNLTRTA